MTLGQDVEFVPYGTIGDHLLIFLHFLEVELADNLRQLGRLHLQLLEEVSHFEMIS